jgi:hypothetical protein
MSFQGSVVSGKRRFREALFQRSAISEQQFSKDCREVDSRRAQRSRYEQGAEKSIGVSTKESISV